jgi:fission process protein 1
MAPKDSDIDVPHTRAEPRPDFSQPIPGKKLPEALQKVLDDDEKLWEVLDDKK